MMTKSPCGRDCPNRTVTCHGFCREYQEWKKIHERELDARRAAQEAGVYQQRRQKKYRRGQI